MSAPAADVATTVYATPLVVRASVTILMTSTVSSVRT